MRNAETALEALIGAENNQKLADSWAEGAASIERMIGLRERRIATLALIATSADDDLDFDLRPTITLNVA